MTFDYQQQVLSESLGALPDWPYSAEPKPDSEIKDTVVLGVPATNQAIQLTATATGQIILGQLLGQVTTNLPQD